jgi:hypothetical protein
MEWVWLASLFGALALGANLGVLVMAILIAGSDPN